MSQSSAGPTRFYGIGVLLRLQNENYIVENMVVGGTAQLSEALSIGDIILEIDGKQTRTRTLPEVLDSLRGPEGSIITLTILKGGQYVEKVRIPRGDVPRKKAAAEARVPVTTPRLVQIQPLVHVNSPHLMQALRDAESMTPRAPPPRLSPVQQSPPEATGGFTHSIWEHSVVTQPYPGLGGFHHSVSAPSTPRGHYDPASPDIRSALASSLAGGATPRQYGSTGEMESSPTRVSLEGWMLKSKRDGLMANFSIRSRYFRLSGRKLSYFVDETTPASPINTLDMAKCFAVKNGQSKFKGKFCLVMTFAKEYFLWLDSKEQRMQWYTALNRAKAGS